MQPAEEAFRALGTNAFPFLLSTLKHNRGNGALYEKAYRIMPAWMKNRLPYPLSSDVIKAITLDYLEGMARNLGSEQLDAVADSVPSFHNPRLTMHFLSSRWLREMYEVAPRWPKLHRKLLNDDDPGIRLEAAMCLAESAFVSDPDKPRLFSILIAGLQGKADRKRNLEIGGHYHFRQPPPGGLGELVSQHEDKALQTRIWSALERLKPCLTPEENARLSQVERPKPNEPQQIDSRIHFISPDVDLHY